LDSGAGGGVAAGLLGTGLMVVMLVYSARRLLIRVKWLGGLQKWLSFHIVCGIMGPLFILVHAGLHWPRGLIAIGFWCMVLVALSGTFGRYVYGFFPRLENGQAMALSDAMDALTDLRAELVAATVDSRSHAIGEAVQLVQDLEFKADSFVDLVRLNREVGRRRARIAELLGSAGLSADVASEAERTLWEQLKLKRGLESSRVVFRLFRYWHLFHRPLASAMYVIVLVHVSVAVLFGNSIGKLAELLEVVP
jgi:hypothetical protein